MKPNDKRRNNPGRPLTEHKKRFRQRIQELIELTGGIFKAADIKYDPEIRDAFGTQMSIDSQVQKELNRLLKTKEIERLDKLGWYKKAGLKAQ